jgi:uncharacterized membrane protein YraQ (UPF0718 family)
LIRSFYVEITGILILSAFFFLLTYGAHTLSSLLEWTRDWNKGLAPEIHSLSTIFISIFIEGLPFILLGVFVSSFVHVFVNEEMIYRWTPKNPLLAVPLATCFGLFLPICECGIVPVVRRLIQKGLPSYVAFTFLLAVPIVNPVTIVATYLAFGDQWNMVLARTLMGAGIAAAMGWIFYFFFRNVPVLKEQADQTDIISKNHFPGNQTRKQPLHSKHEKDIPSQVFSFQNKGFSLKVHNHNNKPHHHPLSHSGCSCDDHHHGQEGRLMHTLTHAVFEFIDMGKYFVVGALIAACFQTFIGLSAVKNFVAGQAGIALLLMMGLAFGLSVCSSADAFIAASFRTAMGTMPTLGFLVYGPIMDLKNLLMMFGSFRRSIILVFFGGTTLLTAISLLLLY